MITLKNKTREQVNFKSDFEIVFARTDHRGTILQPPDFDWEMKLWTTSEKDGVTVYCKGGEFYNCYYSGSDIVVVVNDHGLKPGILKAEYIEHLPHEHASDEILSQVFPVEMDIELVDGPSNYGDVISGIMHLNTIKGDPFVYDDFTDEQIKALQKPATEAANKVLDEENKRAEEEQKRVEAEKKRVEEFATFQDMIDSKQDALSVSKDFELNERSHLSLTNEVKIQSFVDLWNEACMVWWGDGTRRSVGGYEPEVDTTHPFRVFKYRMTLAEAVQCYNETFNYWTPTRQYHMIKSKTLLPIRPPYNTSANNMFFMAKDLEVLDIATTGDIFAPSDATSAFSKCVNLRQMNWPYAIASSIKNKDVFMGCEKLEWVKIYYLHESISFSDSPLLTLDMMKQIATAKTRHDRTNNVTFHPDVYAKLTGDKTNEAAAALDADELKEWTDTLKLILANNLTISC